MDSDGNFFIIVNNGTAKFFKCSKCTYQSEEGAEIMMHALTCQGNVLPVTKPISSQLPSFPGHVTIDCDEFNFECVLCSEKFPDKKSLSKHLDDHWPYKCTVCNGKFKQKIAVRAHEARYHNLDYNANSTDCKTCSLKFQRPRDLFRHLLASHPLRLNLTKISCLKSSSANSRSVGIANTMDITRPSEVVEIIEDDEVVAGHHDPNNLLVAIATDHDDKPFYCDECPKVSENLKEFKDHRKIHYPHKCNLCQKRFSTQYHLGMHDLSEHSQDYKENSTECKICTNDFGDPKTLFLHLIRAHQQARLAFVCKLCPKSFEFKRNFQFHVKTVHKERMRKPVSSRARRRAKRIKNDCALNCGYCFLCKDYAIRLFEAGSSDSSNEDSVVVSKTPSANAEINPGINSEIIPDISPEINLEINPEINLEINPEIILTYQL